MCFGVDEFGGCLWNAGYGGYNCGLWLLFHTMLANADRSTAGSVLSAVHVWVKEFFGCVTIIFHYHCCCSPLAAEIIRQKNLSERRKKVLLTS